MDPVKLLLVGGFLGAGKTTLLWDSARRLMQDGKRVGLITNDQAPELVDTRYLAAQGVAVREVAGSCFCCNFNGLLDAARGLSHELSADVLVAEPVGSCTDLSATILQPLKDVYRQDFQLAPLSVMADPHRLLEAFTGQGSQLHPDARYIVRKQLEEADAIVVNKVDLLDAAMRERITQLLGEYFPETPVFWLSVADGEGVAAWLTWSLSHEKSGQHILGIDYDRYAHGEAVLGWFNGSYRVQAVGPRADWTDLAKAILEGLRRKLKQVGAEAGHVKLLLTGPNTQVKGNLTRVEEPVQVAGEVGGAFAEGEFVLNARVQTTPERLRRWVEEVLGEAEHGVWRIEPEQVRCLSPGRPTPTHRYSEAL